MSHNDPLVVIAAIPLREVPSFAAVWTTCAMTSTRSLSALMLGVKYHKQPFLCEFWWTRRSQDGQSSHLHAVAGSLSQHEVVSESLEVPNAQ
eukprot:4960413-Amphidinium_carterae.2